MQTKETKFDKLKSNWDSGKEIRETVLVEGFKYICNIQIDREIYR